LETEKKSLKSEISGINSYKSQYDTAQNEHKRQTAKYDRLEKEKHDLVIECADCTKQLHAAQDEVMRLGNQIREQTELNQDLNKQFISTINSNKAVDSEVQVCLNLSFISMCMCVSLCCPLNVLYHYLVNLLYRLLGEAYGAMRNYFCASETIVGT